MPENITPPEDFSSLDLLPADAPLTVDEDLQASLDLINAEDLVADPEDTEDIPLPFGRGWGFNFETGQFLRHGTSPAHVYGTDQMRVWIEKTLRTARGAHPLYTDNFGTDYPDAAIGTPFGPEAVGRMKTSISEALLVHDRIEDVSDFRFTGSVADEALLVSFTVLVDDEEIEFNALPLGESF